jgi:hypothetical protein
MQKCLGKPVVTHHPLSGSLLSLRASELTKTRQNFSLSQYSATARQASAASTSTPTVEQKHHKPEKKRNPGEVLHGINADQKLIGGEEFRKARRATSINSKINQTLKQVQQRTQHAQHATEAHATMRQV